MAELDRTLRQFVERERAQHVYQKRPEYSYRQRETARELKSFKIALERERREKERLLALLKEKGMDLGE